MALGPISSNPVSTGLAGGTRLGDQKAADAAERSTIAEHVAALDEQEPIRSVSATLGTLVDTYL